MTSKLKCPVCPMCGSELVRCKTFPYFYYCNCAEYEDIECELDDCAASVPVWEVLRRTNKQLEIARKALKGAVSYYDHYANFDSEISWDGVALIMRNDAHEALEEIEHKE